VKLL
jgi:hypothetical protein